MEEWLSLWTCESGIDLYEDQDNFYAWIESANEFEIPIQVAKRLVTEDEYEEGVYFVSPEAVREVNGRAV